MSLRQLAALLVLVVAAGCASTGTDRRAPIPASREHPAPPSGKKVERGLASWYGDEFHGRPTASGEIFDMNRPSAAHRTLPFGTLVEVKNLDNGRSTEVRINDRGPFVKGRILDLSKAAAARLDMVTAGVARIELRVLAWPPESGPAVPGGSVFQVQAGAFLEETRARSLARGLRHLDPRFRVYSADGWHRVQVRDLDAEAAEELRRRLASEGIDAVVSSGG